MSSHICPFLIALFTGAALHFVTDVELHRTNSMINIIFVVSVRVNLMQILEHPFLWRIAFCIRLCLVIMVLLHMMAEMCSISCSKQSYLIFMKLIYNLLDTNFRLKPLCSNSVSYLEELNIPESFVAWTQAV